MSTSPTPATLPAAPQLGALLTVGEVASYLRVSEMTVYRLITAQQIRATKIGRNWRILTDDLTAYIASCQTSMAS